MSIIIFLLLNFSVGISSCLIAARLSKRSSLPDYCLCWFLVYFSQIVLSELFLGILGILYLENLLLLNLALTLGFWLISRRQARLPNFRLGLGSVFSLLINSKVTLFVFSVAFSFTCCKVFVNLANPPFGWDSLNYHFSFPVEWLRHGNLINPITIFDDPSPSYYPINGSLFYLWLLFGFRSVFLADLGQLPFFLLSFLAVYDISRKIGLSQKSSFLCSLVFILIPNFFKQLQIAYVDIMVAGLFLAAVNFLFLLERQFSWQNVISYSLSLGLLLGTKTVALPYVFLLLVPFIYLCLKQVRRIPFALVVVFLLVLLGGFSYIRNFLCTANPLYPLDYKIWGRPIFKGVMDNLTYGAHFKPEDYRLSKILFHEGLGVQSLIFILPAFFLSLPIALRKVSKRLNFNLVYFLLLPALIYLVYRYVIPLANLRYLYPLLGTGMVCGFFLADILSIPQAALNILVIISTVASMSELAKRQELVSSVILTFFVFISLSYLFGHPKFKKIFLDKISWFIALLILVVSLVFLENWYLKNEYPRYTKMLRYSGFWPDAAKAWDWLNTYTTGNNIAYTGRPVPFPLYGTKLKNNVYYVSVNKTEPARLHYFTNSRYAWGSDFLELHRSLQAPGNYRSEADYTIWLANLLRRNTDYLFVYSLHQTKDVSFPLEDSWAAGHPKKFSLVFTNQTIHIYRLT
jgi:hypothetical protein